MSQGFGLNSETPLDDDHPRSPSPTEPLYGLSTTPTVIPTERENEFNHTYLGA